MRKHKFKAMLAIFISILVLGSISVPASAKENTPVSKTLTVEPRALGDTIAETFPDTRMAQAVADAIASGDVNTVIDISLVNSTTFLSLGTGNIASLEGISVFSELTTLVVTNNEISEIPAEIASMPNLENLSLINNQITEIPTEISSLSNLTSLLLGRNQISEIPVEIDSLSNLENLSLADNQITEIPVEIGNLTDLIDLSLSDNLISEIPAEIDNLTNLVTLLLARNQISELPPEIGNLSNLMILSIAGNQITEIPVEIGNLTSLVSLLVNGNQITKLPAEMDNLISLQNLFLDTNQIIDLPQDMFDFVTGLNSFDLNTQTYTENLTIPGTVDTDYEFDGLPAYEQFPNYGMTFEYSLTLPDGTTISINPSIVDGKVTILSSDLTQVGDYVLIADGTGGALEPVTFTTNFSINDDSATFIVTFDPDNGTSFNEWESVEVVEGELVPNTATIPQKEGYTFIGWASAFDSENNPVLWNFETDVMPSYNMTLWASYEEVVDNGDNNGNGNNGNKNNNGNDNTNPDDKDLSKLPQTGDNSGASAMTLLLAGSLLTGVYLLIRRKEQ